MDNSKNFDLAWEFYQSCTDQHYVNQFAKLGSLSGLTKDELYYGASVGSIDREYDENGEQNKRFIVEGKIYLQEINSIVRVKYSFCAKKDAEAYYEILVREYPNCVVKITEQYNRQIRCYS